MDEPPPLRERIRRDKERNVTNLVRVELRFERMFCILPRGLIYVREMPPSFHTLLPNQLERFIFT